MTTHNALERANLRLSLLVADDLRAGDGCLSEANEDINEASRGVVAAMFEETGDAWLGKFNLYDDDRDKPLLAQWKPGDTVYNFSADFVVPRYDAELERLIRERNTTPANGYSARHNHDSYVAAEKRVKELGGKLLVWT